jgi:hypothetical protein
MAGKVARAGREAVSATKALLGETAATGHEPAFAALWDANATMQA